MNIVDRIRRSVVDNPDLTGAQEMISYGAQVLTRESLPDVLERCS